MTVIELIKILNEYPETMKVLVDGYETGYDDITSIDEKSVYYDDDEIDWWNGNYQETELAKIYSPEKTDVESLSVIIIKGKNR